MKKKIYLSVVCALSAILGIFADDWYRYSSFSGVDDIVETRGRVYFTSDGSLFAYDKDNDETIEFNTQNYLNDNDVTGIYADAGANWVVVAYSSGNMDILRDNGKVVNLPDIKDSRMSAKGINDIAFSPDGSTMIVATSFGVVKYNLGRMEVSESAIFNRDVSNAGYIGNIPVVLSNMTLMWPEEGTKFGNTSSWKSQVFGVKDFFSNHGTLYSILWDGGITVPAILDFSTEGDQITYRVLSRLPVTDGCVGTTDMPFFVVTDNALMAFDSEGQTVVNMLLPDGLVGKPYTASEGASAMWFGVDKGISPVDATSATISEGTPIRVGEMSVRNIHILNYGPSGKLYISNRGDSNVFGLSGSTKGCQAVMEVDGTFRNLTPSGLSESSFMNTVNPDGYLMSPTFMKEDDKDADKYYSGNIMVGFYALSSVDGHEIAHYTEKNSPLTDSWGVRVQDVGFDSRGIMWVLTERKIGLPSLLALSAQGRAKEGNVEKSDWYETQITSDFYADRDGKIVVSAQGRYIYLAGSTDLYIYDTKGTADFSDDTGIHVTTYRMHDGSGFFSFLRIHDVMEDPATGALWITCTDGVFYIPEPWNVNSQTVDIVRPKVPRNDGTGLADYLLSAQKVYGMDIDPAGHKWFTTSDAGVYLVSGDGTEILKNLTSENTPLVSNTVFSVACDPSGSDKVYFGTGYGLFEYRSDYTVGSQSYDNVKIYPNPVKPDYYGDITIQGLMDGSTVKIVSASGALIAQLQGEGGTIKWNARTPSGSRLPSGVYHVLASTENGDGSVVGKIVIVR